MTTDSVISAVVHEFDDFTLEVEDQESETLQNYCDDAKAYHRWVMTSLEQHLRDHAGAIGINQAILMLVKQYFEWRECVPKSHRNHIGERGHVCIYQVFEQGYNRLRRAELALNPPLLFLPPPPPKTVLHGTILGLGE